MTQDSPSDVLRRARIDKGYRSASEAARAHGWTVSTYVSHENGTRNISEDAAAKYSVAFGVSAKRLTANSSVHVVETVGVPVTGKSQVGVWVEMSVDEKARQNVPLIPIPLGSGVVGMRFAVQCIDDSLNLQRFFDGDFAICDNVDGKQQLMAGRIYFVERVRGDMAERSLRLLQEKSEGLWFVSSSSVSMFSGNGFPANGSSSESVRVLGKVVGQYKSLE